MNVKLLEQIKQQILLEPEQFEMNSWFVKRPGVPNCGTAACIAGWAITLFNQKNPDEQARALLSGWGRLPYCDMSSSAEVSRLAKEVLNLPDDTGQNLFHVRFWPEQFSTPYYAASGNRKERAKIAAARIDHFIQHQE